MAKDKVKDNIGRQPVIAVLGHVDHGKTTLLDTIRGTSVQKCEVGGITQNTRAHVVDYKGHKITFIDTPGHEAFSGMRSRGANVTDVVLLVVAADDGVKPQTKESIKFAQDAKAPILVAINKMDIPGIDLRKIKNELSQCNVLVEDYGGDVQVFEVSAKEKTGIEDLLEGVLLQAEVLELKKEKAKYGDGMGIILESRLDNKLGPIALILIKAGKVKSSDYVAYDGKSFGIRALLDDCQLNVDEACESNPVWVIGLNEVMQTGEILYFTDDPLKAKEISKCVESHCEELQDPPEVPEATFSEDDGLNLLASILANEQKDEEIKKLNIVVRADTQGTLEVVLDELKKLSDEDAEINIIKSGTGDITNRDVLTAKNAKGIVIGFQVSKSADVDKVIKQERVLVRIYSVIYELIDEVSDALDSLLEPAEVEEEVARATIKKVFVLSNGSKVAGCIITGGKVIKGYKVWVERRGEEIGRSKITSLKQQKNEVKEMTKGSECGIALEPAVDIEEGDEIVLYKVIR